VSAPAPGAVNAWADVATGAKRGWRRPSAATLCAFSYVHEPLDPTAPALGVAEARDMEIKVTRGIVIGALGVGLIVAVAAISALAL